MSSFLPGNLLSAAVLLYSGTHFNRDDIKENDFLAMALLPLRVVLYLVCVIVSYPIMLMTAFFYAVYARVVHGTAADILKTSLSSQFKSGSSYPCQFVFTKPITNPKKFTSCVESVAKEIGMELNKVCVVFEKEVPADFPKTNGFSAGHYVKKGANFFKNATNEMLPGGYHLKVNVHNAKEGKPTVMQCFLPGHTLDGTSCFNLAKEFIARYHGETHEVVVPTQLNPTADAKLRSASFGSFLASLPYNILLNTSDFCWMLCSSQRFLGGPGLSFEMTLLNFSEGDSKRLTAGLKKRNVKPFAGFIYAAFHAYSRVLGQKPFNLIQQSSMQSRNYEPELKDRRYVGDWLIGVAHKFQSKEFTLEDAMKVYKDLISNLNNMEGPALNAAMAKAYCPLGGAAVYELFPFYGDKARVMDSIFFNNYGLRDVHPDSGFYSYNWGAPFRLGFNTSCTNGKTCLCLASSHMSVSKLNRVRAEVEKILTEFME